MGERSVRHAPSAAGNPPRATSTAVERLRGDAADDLAPPVDPTLVRSREIPGARDLGRNTVEILVFRELSTPLALALVVLQSRFLARRPAPTMA